MAEDLAGDWDIGVDAFAAEADGAEGEVGVNLDGVGDVGGGAAPLDLDGAGDGGVEAEVAIVLRRGDVHDGAQRDAVYLDGEVGVRGGDGRGDGRGGDGVGVAGDGGGGLVRGGGGALDGGGGGGGVGGHFAEPVVDLELARGAAAAGQIAGERGEEKLRGRDVQLRAAVDVVQADVLVLVGSVVELDLADEEVAVLAVGVGGEFLRGGGGGFVAAAFALEELPGGLGLLRGCGGYVAVVAVDAEVERAGVEAVDAGEDLELLELERAGDLGLPLRVGEVVQGGGGGELGVLAGVEVELGELGHVAADLGFEMQAGLGFRLLGHLGAEVAEIQGGTVTIGRAEILDGGVEVGGGEVEGDGAVVDEGYAVDELYLLGPEVEEGILNGLSRGRGVFGDGLVGLALFVDDEVDAGLFDP